MLRFFRQIRQRLLTDNKFSKYLLYAVGEILLVVIGILIALQVDSWNEKRIQRNRYEFGIERVHKRIIANSLYWDTYKDRAQYQVLVIDSLLDNPDSMPPNRILGNLLSLDLLVREWYIGYELYLDYLNFFPTDSVQFDIYETLRRYFIGVYEEEEGRYFLKEEESFKYLLTNHNIPICDYFAGESFLKFVLRCSKEEFSSEYSNDIISLVGSREIRAKLNLRRARCMNLLVMSKPEINVLETLEESFEFLDGRLKTIEIVGSGTMSGSWDEGIKMTSVNQANSIWRKTIKLRDGEIKFREDDKWVFNWGTGELDQGKLVFGGPNIPVLAGDYDIVIDIEKNTFQLIPL